METNLDKVTKPLTLAEFRATGRIALVDETGEVHSNAGHFDGEVSYGRVYELGCFIYLDIDATPTIPATWRLVIERSEYEGKLSDMEEVLYRTWYLPECCGYDLATEVFERVCQAMQPAEEMGGLTSTGYIDLMMKVAREAERRAVTCATLR
jgi:hypothetical protein